MRVENAQKAVLRKLGKELTVGEFGVAQWFVEGKDEDGILRMLGIKEVS